MNRFGRNRRTPRTLPRRVCGITRGDSPLAGEVALWEGITNYGVWICCGQASSPNGPLSVANSLVVELLLTARPALRPGHGDEFQSPRYSRYCRIAGRPET